MAPEWPLHPATSQSVFRTSNMCVHACMCVCVCVCVFVCVHMHVRHGGILVFYLTENAFADNVERNAEALLEEIDTCVCKSVATGTAKGAATEFEPRAESSK